jgi:phage-related protein
MRLTDQQFVLWSFNIVDIFWKKTNKVSLADIHRANDRIRRLKALLATGGDPWKSGE